MLNDDKSQRPVPCLGSAKVVIFLLSSIFSAFLRREIIPKKKTDFK